MSAMKVRGMSGGVDEEDKEGEEERREDRRTLYPEISVLILLIRCQATEGQVNGSLRNIKWPEQASRRV